MNTTNFTTGLKERIKATKPTRWARFGIVALLVLAWTAWMGNWWLALLLVPLFDIYITGYIPFTWWKNSKSKAVRTVMSWVDAIVYAIIVVYFVFAFVGQNYQIPSSSLEKSLLVGDYLWVNKMAYGPRVPMTPVHFPLVQNTMPAWLGGTKSYLDNPQIKYHRLKGLDTVKTGDIVVFNFPAGDTVAVNMQNPDYHTLVRLYGREAVNSGDPAFGEIIYRPVDRRENYVKRTVGLPGETLEIRSDSIFINGKLQPTPADAQHNYYFQTRRPLTESDFERLDISVDDRHRISTSPADYPALATMGFDTNADGTIPPIYFAPLTAGMRAQMLAQPNLFSHLMKQPAPTDDTLFPEGIADGWTRADYGPIWIPRRGTTIPLNRENWATYNRCIRNYEGHHDAYIDESGTVYIDGKPADSYTFDMDYYFMMGDNRDNSLDSRYWGFVPEDHIVGKPMMILLSLDKDKGLFSGGIRWNRILRSANPQ